MLPSVNLRRKRSTSKLSCEFGDSPYNRIITRTAKVKSVAFLKQASPSIGYCSHTDYPVDTQKFKDFKNLSESMDLNQKISPAEFETALKERMERFRQGDSEYVNELEIVENLFEEVLECFRPYEKIMNLLKSKIKECAYHMAKEDLEKKIEKVKKENNSLLGKINQLSDINTDLLEEKNKLEVANEDFVRILKHNPDFLINYDNIVNQMLSQCELIEAQKKEIKKLKKTQENYEKLLEEIRKCRYLDTSNSDDSPLTKDRCN